MRNVASDEMSNSEVKENAKRVVALADVLLDEIGIE